MLVFRAMVPLLVLSACGALSQRTLDGGSAGLDSGQVITPPGDDGGQAHPGSDSGVMGVVDSGTITMPADAGPTFVWTTYSFSPTPGVPSRGYSVRGLAQRQDGALWVALGDGTMYRAPTGSSTLTKVGVFSTTDADQIIALVTTPTELFVVREDLVLGCASPCTQRSDFTTVYTFIGVNHGVGACASGNTVYVVENDNAITGLIMADRTAGGAFSEVTSNLPTESGETCWADAQVTVYVAGSTAVDRRDLTGITTTESITLSEINAASWRAVSGTTSQMWLVGFGSGPVVAKRSGTSWLQSAYSGGTSLLGFTTISAVGDSDFLLGVIDENASAPVVYELTHDVIAPVQTSFTTFDVNRSLRVGDNEVVLGGANRASGGYSVVRGVRVPK